MDKLKMQSPNLVEQNIDKIAELFPNCITEDTDENGQVKRAVDFDLLRQELSVSLVEGPRERYALTWPGKNEAILISNAPVAKTLRPCEEESVDFETTKNVFIEGDNLEALKLLQETYLGKVKMIYIDPPYNTGNDFVYKDDFAENTEEFLTRSNQKDDSGNRLVANPETNGRFHSVWLNMIYPRLRLARNLLSDDGVIFITIDDNEASNLKLLCDQVFGAHNFRAQVSWQKKYSVSNNFKGIASVRDFIFIYSNSSAFENGLLPRTEASKKRYLNPDKDPRGPWKPVDYWNIASVDQRPNCVYPIINPHTGNKTVPTKKSWKFERSTHEQHVAEDRIWWGKDRKNSVPALKLFLSDVKDGMIPHNWWPYDEVGHTDQAKKYLDKLFGGVSPFDTPKPLKLIERMLQIARLKENDIVLDFFAGSCSTAEAVIRYSAEGNANIRFIMIQMLEECVEKSEGAKQGYRTIAEIGKKRIRLAGKKIKKEGVEKAQNLDIGFRVFKVDTSNMKDVYYSPDELKQGTLDLFKEHIKPGRHPEDLLFQIFLDWGLDLALPINKETIDEKNVFFVDSNAMLACFDSGITLDLVKKLAKRKPLRAVFRDDAFGSDSVKINVEQIFKTLSPFTEVKSI